MKRFVLLSVVLAALLSLSCPGEGSNITLVNSGRDPFHPNGGAKLEVGASGRVIKLSAGSVETITLDRMGAPWATLEVTSTYDAKAQCEDATITVTEPTYGTFVASSDNSNITVTVTN
jgi:hypothetical protein